MAKQTVAVHNFSMACTDFSLEVFVTAEQVLELKELCKERDCDTFMIG
jgi:hypothetical protein